MPHEARVLTVSTSVSQGAAADRSGPAVAELLTSHGFFVSRREVVRDGVDSVGNALLELGHGYVGLLATTGGTGFSPDDLTPEATSRFVERTAPGLAEAMRATSPLGRLSRGVAGVRGTVLVLNLPGSEAGAREALSAVIDVLGHAVDLLAGASPHGHAGGSSPA